MAQQDAKLSVIIPVFNNWALTEQCLTSLEKSFQIPPISSLPALKFEAIIVDNGSYDETPKSIEKWANSRPNLEIQYLRQEKNLGFAKACNLGAKAAFTQNLIFLNNDTFVFKGALHSLFQTAKASPSIGIVGSRLLYPDYTIQHAGMAMDDDYNWHHVFRTFHGEHPAVLIKRSFQSVTGACFYISKQLFEKVGGLDEGYLNSHEDVDLCFKVRAEGYEIIYDPNSVLIHFERMSEGRLEADKPAKNRFVSKWKEVAKADLNQASTHFANNQAYRLQSIIEQTKQVENPYNTVPVADWAKNTKCMEFQIDQFRIAQLKQSQTLLDLIATKEELLNTKHLVNALNRQNELIRQSKTFKLGNLIKRCLPKTT